jgi:hypothetical protein
MHSLQPRFGSFFFQGLGMIKRSFVLIWLQTGVQQEAKRRVTP